MKVRPVVGSRYCRIRNEAMRKPCASQNAKASGFVAQQLRFNPWWSVEVLAERQSVIVVHSALCKATERLLAALVAINRRYHPGLKWLPELVTSLAIAPPALENRLARCFQADLGDRVGVAAALVEETFDLAAQHVPGLDVAARRDRFRQRREPIEALPPRPVDGD